MTLLSLLSWKLLGLTKRVVRDCEWISFIKAQIRIADQLKVQGNRLGFAELFIADLRLRQDLTNYAAHHYSLFQTLQIDPTDLEFLMNILL